MPILTERLGQLTILSGATVSNTLGSQLSAGQLKTALGFLDALTIYNPQGLAEDTMIQLSPVETPASGDWVDYALIDTTLSDDILTEDSLVLMDENSAALQTESESQGGLTNFEDVSFRDLRLKAMTAVAADRVFTLLAKLLVH